MLQAGIETQLTLHQPDYITSQPVVALTQAREFNVYVLTSVCLHFTLLDTEVLCSLEELCLKQMATVNSFGKVLSPPNPNPPPRW